jgi:hypothetical protein
MDLEFRPIVIFWACLALGLIALETLVPGAALIWLGLAAGVVLLLVVFLPGLPVFWQAVIFVLMSFAIVFVYWRKLRRTGIATTQPLLNRKTAQLVGQVYRLESAIENGRGRIRIGDAFWQVEGPDLPVGTPVRIVGARSAVLLVEPA